MNFNMIAMLPKFLLLAPMVYVFLSALNAYKNTPTLAAEARLKNIIIGICYMLLMLVWGGFFKV